MLLFTFVRRIGLEVRAARTVDVFLSTKRRTQMETKARFTYEEAVYALNGLQSNAAYIQKARKERSSNANRNLIDAENHLKMLGIKVEDLNSLNIIHVSGTKGKGSTCAITESILRHHGLKTGFYSSPHLITVNERVRINGKPISKDQFAAYFWHVFDTLQRNLESDGKLPSYFHFLTVLAFYVFMKEKVDVAVIEVGIGGLYDCTNVIQKPVVVGVTTLGLDHVSLLGDTIAKITEQKAGIFKSSVSAYTVPQEDGALDILKKEAQRIGCSLSIAPPIEAYEQMSGPLNLGVPGVVQKLNASLALQLSRAWLDKKMPEVLTERCPEVGIPSQDGISHLIPVATTFHLSSKFIEGLQSCFWPGRFQTVSKGKFTFYFDGAHTLQSIKHCSRWFQEISKEERARVSGPVIQILLFNCTGERKAESLLDPLSELNFDLVLFSPNRLSEMKNSASDQSNFTVDPTAELEQCKKNQEIWCHLMRSFHENSIISSLELSSSFGRNTVHKSKYCDPDNTLLFTCLSSALSWLIQDSTHVEDVNCVSSSAELLRMHQILSEAEHVQVLVTGSLHLVGNVLGLIDFNL